MATQIKKAVSLKYADLLAQSHEEKSIEDRQYLVEQKKLQLQADILATKKSLGEAKKEKTELLRSPDLSFKALADAEDRIEELEKGVARLQSYNELF
jgi:GTP-binding protein EngB required for normal cell division